MTGKLLTLDDTLRPTLSAFLALLDVPVDDPLGWTAIPRSAVARSMPAARSCSGRRKRNPPPSSSRTCTGWIARASPPSIASSRVCRSADPATAEFPPRIQHRWSAKSYYSASASTPSAAELGGAAADRLGDDASLRARKQLLIARTEGNPFFLEESARTLVESGALDGRRGNYRLVAPMTNIALPVTVQSVLAAHIDRLAPKESGCCNPPL